MKKLKIVSFGTANYLEKYSKSLQEDCEKFGYGFTFITIPDQSNISAINHTILESMVDYLEWKTYDRICFMDPECRIIKPIPEEWINADKPIVFFKVRYKDGTSDPKFVYKNKNGNGERLPCRIIGQPMFVSKQDIAWLKMILNLAKAASDIDNAEYTRNELFIETALNYCKVDYLCENIIYERECTVEHKVVKGLWQTEDTIIQHPDIYGLFDNDILAGNPYTDKIEVLDETVFKRHVSNINTLKDIDEAMWKEKTNKWLTFEQWQVQPSTGKLKFGNLKGIKYHHSVLKKIELGLKTPVAKQFGRNYNKNI